MRPYRSWQDLLPEADASRPEPRQPTAKAASAADRMPALDTGAGRDQADARTRPTQQAQASATSAPARSGAGGLYEQVLASLPDGSALPPEVLAVLDDYARAEAHLRQLTGQEKHADADPREEARFPLKVHTPSSRLEEKRLARLDEQASQGRKRLTEQRLIRIKQERSRQEALARQREAARLASIRERIRAEQERQRRTEDAARRAQDARDRDRWELNRSVALRSASLARRELAAHEERQLDVVRGQCLSQRRRVRDLEADEEHRRQQALERAKARRREGLAHG